MHNKKPFLLFFTILTFLNIQIFAVDKFQGFLKYETEHFEIIFEKRDEEAAKEVYSFCEEIYNNVTSVLKNYPKKISIVIHGRIDTANGSYYPVPEHLNLYVTSPSQHFLGVKTENWLYALLTHELTHFVHMSYNSGWLYNMSKFFGPILKPAPAVFQPGWMLEGITTYLETKFTNGGRGRNPFFEMTYKAPILEHNIFTYKQAAYSGYNIPQGRIYTAGYMLVNYLMTTYGDDVFYEIQQEIIKNPLKPNEAIKLVTGCETEQIYSNMLEFYDKKFEKYKNIPKAELISKYTKSNYSMPKYTKKGIIAYKSGYKEKNGFVLINPKTKVEEKILNVSITDSNAFDVTKDGEIIIFSSFDINPAHQTGTTLSSSIFTYNTTTKKVTRITKDSHLIQPSIAENREFCVAVKLLGSYSYLVKIDLPKNSKNSPVKEETKLFYKERTNIRYPDISSDNSSIAFEYNDRGYNDILILENDKDIQYITGPDDNGEYFPQFINQKSITFSSDKNGSLELYTYDLKNKAYKLIAEDRVGAYTGFILDNKVIYGSYSSTGYSIKRKKYSPILSENFTTKTKPNYPDFKIKNPTAKKYIDYPRFVAWSPMPFYYTPQASIEAPFGLGFFLYAQSIVYDTYIYTTISNPLTLFQPSAQLNAHIGMKVVNLDIKFNQSYFSYNTQQGKKFSQLTSSQIDFKIPIYQRAILGKSFGTYFKVGLLHNFMLTKNSGFNITDVRPSTYNSFTEENTLYFTNTFSAYYYGLSPRFIPYYNESAYLNFSSQTKLPLKSSDKALFKSILNLGGTIPITEDQAISLDLQISNVNFTPNTPSVSIKGFDTEKSDLKGTMLLSLGYNFPIAILDLPLFAHLSMHALSAQFFSQMKFDFDSSKAYFNVGKYIYFGAELKLTLGFSQATFPVTFGVNSRINLQSPQSFDAKTDLKPFFSTNILSFITGAKSEEDKLYRYKN